MRKAGPYVILLLSYQLSIDGPIRPASIRAVSWAVVAVRFNPVDALVLNARIRGQKLCKNA
jgi:hypothetical protein